MYKFLPKIISSVAITAVLLPQISFAYIDPGTGSFFIQLLAAAIFGASFALRFVWRRVFNFFKKLFGLRVADTQNVKEEMEKDDGTKSE